MPGPTNSERVTRHRVQEIHAAVEGAVAPDKAAIRREALAMFRKALDSRLRNLQVGEKLMITFRVDIETAPGKIRGGQNSERHMPAYAVWRRAVMERDGYLCRLCGARGELHAHHIMAWSKRADLRFDVANGLTLCPACHAAQHPHLGVLHHGQAK